MAERDPKCSIASVSGFFFSSLHCNFVYKKATGDLVLLSDFKEVIYWPVKL